MARVAFAAQELMPLKRSLGFDLGPARRNPLERLLRILPNKVLKQLACFRSDGHCHFLRVVELGPVPRIAEGADLHSEFLDTV